MNIPEYDIAGRKVLLVGAARGIGKGIALVLAEAGAEVAIASLNIKSAADTASEITSYKGKAVAFAADATKAGDMERLAREVLASFGPLDVLVNCVGDAIGKPVVKLPGQLTEGMTGDEWRFIVDVNLTQAFTSCRAFGPHLLEQRHGSVINISGVAAFRAAAARSAYDAAKAGLVRFTEALALEWAPYRVRVNSIAPGSFPDPAQVTPEAFQQRDAAAATRVPLGRVGRLREVGLLALYLASDASAYVTGQTWCIDGGASVA
ncbi:MAG: SDR family NAD(P)-dependent oxidoreductase [Dehalococcoidia bacterium]|nr:SDR family NAD(P)-dependent oxidoreductase [Dehalococcoidia bacterium]